MLYLNLNGYLHLLLGSTGHYQCKKDNLIHLWQWKFRWRGKMKLIQHDLADSQAKTSVLILE